MAEPCVARLAGLRFFTVARDGFWSPLQGGDWSAHYRWEFDRNKVSECGLGKKHESGWDPKCSCGFYGIWQFDDLLEYMAFADSPSLAIGVVNVWGRVEDGPVGFRAQFARLRMALVKRKTAERNGMVHNGIVRDDRIYTNPRDFELTANKMIGRPKL